MDHFPPPPPTRAIYIYKGIVIKKYLANGYPFMTSNKANYTRIDFPTTPAIAAELFDIILQSLANKCARVWVFSLCSLSGSRSWLYWVE